MSIRQLKINIKYVFIIHFYCVYLKKALSLQCEQTMTLTKSNFNAKIKFIMRKTTSKTTVLTEKKESSLVPENKVAIDKTTEIKIILSKVEKLENLRTYYGKLKVKETSLKESLETIKSCADVSADQFEEKEQQEFPFDIALRKKDYYGKKEDVFTISRIETVENFTKYLLSQVSELLDAFEKDLIQESKKGNI